MRAGAGERGREVERTRERGRGRERREGEREGGETESARQFRNDSCMTGQHGCRKAGQNTHTCTHAHTHATCTHARTHTTYGCTNSSCLHIRRSQCPGKNKQTESSPFILLLSSSAHTHTAPFEGSYLLMRTAPRTLHRWREPPPPPPFFVWVLISSVGHGTLTVNPSARAPGPSLST